MTTPTNDGEYYDDLLGGRTVPSASYRGQPPIRWEGTVVGAKKMPAFTYDPSKPGNRGAQKYWDDGNPVEHTWVTIQTEIRDPSIQDDDGQRILVLDSKAKRDAMNEAVRQSGGRFGKGSWVLMEYYATDPQSKNPDNPRKLYRAQHRPPAPQPATNDPWAGVNAAAPTPAPTPQPVAPPMGATAGVNPATAAFLHSKGVSAVGLDPAVAEQIAAGLRAQDAAAAPAPQGYSDQPPF